MLLEYRIIPAEDKESNSSMVFGKPISCNSLIGLNDDIMDMMRYGLHTEYWREGMIPNGSVRMTGY